MSLQKADSHLAAFNYGIGELGPSAIDFFLKIYLLIFYNEIIKLNPTLTGLALGIGVLWDALIDPTLGKVSDKIFNQTRSRAKMIWFGMLLLGISVIGLFSPPQSLNSDYEKFAYLLFFSTLMNSSYSVFIVPYLSLANDYLDDQKSRARWVGWRMAFLNIGAFVGLGIPAYFLLTEVTVEKSGSPYTHSAWFIVFIFFIFTAYSLFKTFQLEAVAKEISEKKVTLRSVFKNDSPFVVLLLGFLILSTGITLNSSLAIYYYKNRLQFTESEVQTVLIVFLLFFTLSIPAWILAAKKYSMRKMMAIGGILLGVSNAFIYPLLPVGQLIPALIFASMWGGCLVGVAVLLEVLLSNLLRHREVELKTSVTGFYLGIWKTSSKISRALALVMTGPLLLYTNADTSGFKLALFFGLGVGFFFVFASIIIGLWYKEPETTSHSA